MRIRNEYDKFYKGNLITLHDELFEYNCFIRLRKDRSVHLEKGALRCIDAFVVDKEKDVYIINVNGIQLVIQDYTLTVYEKFCNEPKYIKDLSEDFELDL